MSARIKASALGQAMGYEALLKKFAREKGLERKKDAGSDIKI